MGNNSDRKEAKIQDVLKTRGSHPGLVHILSAMETCPSYAPWHDKKTHQTFLKPKTGRCLHYYFYFIDESFGLCYLRVPTWCPFRLQFYFNGHNWLAAQLKRAGIAFQLLDNAFVNIEHLQKAKNMVDNFSTRKLHQMLDRFARIYCPIISRLGIDYRWSLMQAEYATDIVFKRQEDLAAIYETIIRTAIHTVKPDHISTFLGRKLNGNYQDEMGNNFSIRLEGSCLRHKMGPVSIKMYDKFSLVLRIETTTNNISFFKHHRRVDKRDGTSVYKLASLKKSIYSLKDLSAILHASNQRYIDFISEIEIPTASNKQLTNLFERKVHGERSYKGFNFFSAEDQRLFEILSRGEYNIYGMRNADLKQHLQGFNPGRISRLLKRLHVHGLIKRIGNTYKYYLTALGKKIILTGLNIKQQVGMYAFANG